MDVYEKTFFMLSLLIPGPNAPGVNIDVYLQPLIEELKELWDVGIETYDASKKHNFHMHAAVLWTINDFPAYANLSGWSTKGMYACPSCNMHTSSRYLTHGKKICYMCHRRFLPMNHKWRIDIKHFDGTKELRDKPPQLSGDDVLQQLQGIFEEQREDQGGTSTEQRETEGAEGESSKSKVYWKKSWKKKSIFFELPYWRTLLLRHNLDVMHIEKNVCDSVLGTLLNIEGKTKDSLKARLDLKEMYIREQLHPIEIGEKMLLPSACYTLSSDEKLKLYKFLKELKVPDGYSSNISRCVNLKERKLSSLKSHDCHVLKQRLLALAIRNILPKNVCEVLIELSTFFRELCSKVLKVEELELLESHITVILCKLEMIFPPAFFDMMVHLLIHLPSEAKIAGPVQLRWMYPIERYIRTLKSYMRNKSRPEGSIAEGYLAEECLTFCSRYLHGIETKFNRLERNYDGHVEETSKKLSVFTQTGRALGKATSRELTREEWLQARHYVLKNCDEIKPFFEEHKQLVNSTLDDTHIRDVDNIHDRDFPDWFESRVTQLFKQESGAVDEQLLSLARGPDYTVTCYKGYIVNGFRFHTKNREREMKTQNSGVFVIGETNSYASARDNHPIVGNVNYYGVLTDIIELHYLGAKRTIVFKCDWRDVYNRGKGIKTNVYGFTSLNFARSLRTNEPFVLGCQAEQVFYVRDNVDSDWYVAQRTEPRDFYNMHVEEEVPGNDNPYQQREANKSQNLAHVKHTDEDVLNCDRTDIPGEIVDANVVQQQKTKRCCIAEVWMRPMKELEKNSA